jgi:signal transduction histidine kinase
MSDSNMKKNIVFVVEDDFGLLSLISKKLARMDYDVEGFSNGKKLIERLKHKTPSLMLMDYRLADMTAKELIEDLKNENMLTPFIIMTAYGSETLAVEMMKLGANDYLVKDNSFLELLPSVVKQSVKHFAMEKQLIQTQKENKELEIMLQQATKMEAIGTLAGGIAHDFNNILYPIVGHVEMLMEDVSDDSPFNDSLNEIYTSALRARDLVRQILTFSRQENNEPKLINPQLIIKEALKLIRSTIPTSIKINQDLDSDCGRLIADSTQLHQIVMNLTTNAYHAMEKTGGELSVSLKKVCFDEHKKPISPEMTPGTYTCLAVSDTGTGMNNELTKKIFDPFFTTKEMGKGTGMGLSVVHGIVKNMHGAIEVNSEPGRGTEFKVYFPAVNNLAVQNKPRTKKPIKGGTEKILLIDDEEGILVMLKKVLTRLGYQVTSYVSPIDALETFRSNPAGFDLVITDMAMPVFSGDKLSVALTQIRPDIPVLLCTGFSESISSEKAASLGIKGFLMKPIVIKDLSEKIREVLNGAANKTQ